MKKSIVVYVVLAVALLLLQGCGSGSSNDNDNSDTSVIPAPTASENSAISIKRDSTYAVDVTLDVTYAEGLTHTGWLESAPDSMPMLLDIYQPVGLEGKKPAYIFFHGGGFIGGSKSQTSPVEIISYLVERGFVGISVDYRVLGDFGTIPSEWNQYADLAYQQGLVDLKSNQQSKAIYPAVRDAKAAMRWVFANAESLGIDTRYVTVAGGSAGGFIAFAIGNTDASDYRDEISIEIDPTLSTANIEQDYDVKTIIDFWGGTAAVDLPLMIFNGESRWGSNDVPACIIHGTEDPTVLYEQATTIQTHYANNGVEHQLITLEGYGHGAWGAVYEGKTLDEITFNCITEYQPELNVD